MSQPALDIIQPPNSPSNQPLPLLIVLHGNNSTNEIEKTYWSVAHEWGYLVAFFQSSQIMNPGRYMWNNLAITVPEIKSLFQQVLSDYAVDMNKIVVGGFSRGAFAGWWTSLGQDIPATEFIGVASVVPDADLEATCQRAQNCSRSALKTYLLMGEDDPYGQTKPRQVVDILTRRGFTCILDSRPNLGHDYPSDFAAILKSILT